MPKIHEMIPSSYLKKEDCDPPILVTINGVKEEDLAMEGKPQEMKWVMYFDEREKGIVLNNTNIQLCAQICGSDDTDGWIGKKIVLYSDPNVSFGGKLVGGIRVRAPKSNGKPAQARPATTDDVNRRAQEVADMENDIPFLFNMSDIQDAAGKPKSLWRAKHGKELQILRANKIDC